MVIRKRENKYYLYCWVLLIVIINTTQLSAFTLTVNKTDEFCTANGTLTMSVSNTVAGATMVYTIYRLPNVTIPIAVQSATSLSGLVAGTYQVIATESVGSSSTSQQQEIVIDNTIIPLTYQLAKQNVRCGNDGSITVNVLTGSPNYQYEIFQGPMIFPLQTSNVFSGLVAGQYTVRVFDACGEGVVQVFTIGTNTTALQLYNIDIDLLTCATLQVRDAIVPNNTTTGVVVYPLTVQYTVNPPAGPPLVLPPFSLYPFNGAMAIETIPYYYNQPYNYTIQVTDGCNNIYQQTINVNVHLDLTLTLTNQACLGSLININPVNFVPPYNVTFLQSPTGYIPINGNPSHPGPFTDATSYNSNGLNGLFTIQITDACGRTASSSIMVNNQPTSIAPTVFKEFACEEGFGAITIKPGSPILSVTLINSPAAYNVSLPFVLGPEYIVSSNNYYGLGPVPPGTYTFSITDICGIQYQKTTNVIGYHQIANTTTILYHCGSFDIDLHNSSNNEPFTHYWLQKYNPVTQQWGHPQTGVVYVSGSGPYFLNSIALVNNSVNYNFNFLGTFRILKSYSTFGNGQFFYCDTVVKEFTYDGSPKLIKVYTLSCTNGAFDVIVDAIGASPLQYRIIEKDGQPYVVENGNSYIFSGIPAGHYKFQIEDPCGNILNSEFDVPSPFDFGITATSFCNGQSGSLILPNFSILQYEWWKDNNTATILSTTNALSFSAFNSVNDSGVYHVRVKYTGNPNSCIDFVLNYTIASNSSNPHAGLDNSISYCGNQGVLDLFTLLLGTFDTNGTWHELTNSGALTNNLWDSSAVPNSIYQFRYTVNGTCNTSDESLINVEIKEAPKDLTASVNPSVCENQDVALTASSILNANYSWTGPNGFSTLEQNPIIVNASALNSGTYTVIATIGDCTSDTVPVVVNVNKAPIFTLDSGCEVGRYLIKATPVNNSFDATTVSYLWNGPNNYTNTSNPIDITNLAAGIYSLIITDANSCDSTQSISVPTTFCEIPNVITPNNDGTNDELDLSGLGVNRIEIYNRWGRKVYEKNMYLKEWHGQNMQGNQLPDSTYYYYIILQNNESKVGWVFVNGS